MIYKSVKQSLGCVKDRSCGPELTGMGVQGFVNKMLVRAAAAGYAA